MPASALHGPALTQAATQNSKTLGSLAITVTGAERTQSPDSSSDHYRFIVHVQMKNSGTSAICDSFSATLRATFGLQYAASFLLLREQPKIREMLPGESTSGRYTFDVKNGAEPLALVLKPRLDNPPCTTTPDTSARRDLPSELDFDLAGFVGGQNASEGNSAETQTPRPSGDQKPRVFLTDDTRVITSGKVSPDSKPPTIDALKAFTGRCSDAVVTVDKDHADYIIVLHKTRFGERGNRVGVLTPGGDLLYGGLTILLSSAAERACKAVVTDFHTRTAAASTTQ